MATQRLLSGRTQEALLWKLFPIQLSVCLSLCVCLSLSLSLCLSLSLSRSLARIFSSSSQSGTKKAAGAAAKAAIKEAKRGKTARPANICAMEVCTEESVRKTTALVDRCTPSKIYDVYFLPPTFSHLLIVNKTSLLLPLPLPSSA